MLAKITSRPYFQIPAAFFSTWALSKAGRLNVGNLLTLLLFVLLFCFYRQVTKRTEKENVLSLKYSQTVVLALSVLFTFLYMVVDYGNYVQTLSNALFRLIVLFAVALGFVFLFYYTLLFLYSYTIKPISITEEDPRYGKHLMLTAVLICFVCWLPYFLYLFPGVMTPDSVNQFKQAIGTKPYSNHHPIAHTLLIKLFYQIGLLFTDNTTVAFSFYTVFQMLVLAFSIAFLVQTLAQYKVKKWICYGIILFYALIPYHGVYASTIWKDILFAAAVLVFGSCLLRLLKQTDKGTIFFFILSGIMICLFRSNGWYGFLLCFPFLLIHFRKKAKQLYLPLFGILAAAIIVKYPIMNAAGVIQPDFVESLCIPTQQIAAVIANDRPLTEEQLTLIGSVIEIEHVKTLYEPTFADNMKELVRAGNQEYLVDHKKEFFRLWLGLGLTYPGDYFRAYINQTYGYYYPDCFYPVSDAEGIWDSGVDIGIVHTPLLRGPIAVKLKEISIKLGNMLPLYGILWSMGSIFWIYLFCIGNTLLRKEYQKLICYLPTLCIFGTVLIATPVASEFRYAYFLVLGLPFYLMTTLLPLAGPEVNSSKQNS